MPATKLPRAATLDWLCAVVGDLEGVHLRDLPPLTTLLVRTVNSVYRMVVTQGAEVCVQGGAFFPDPTSAWLDGAGMGGSCLRLGWIGVGFVMQIRARGRLITTSPVQAIAAERSARSVVH